MALTDTQRLKIIKMMVKWMHNNNVENNYTKPEGYIDIDAVEAYIQSIKGTYNNQLSIKSQAQDLEFKRQLFSFVLEDTVF